MSISPVGNSDAYERYRQQQLDLLASPTQASTQNAPTDHQSVVHCAGEFRRSDIVEPVRREV
jgi:hypothetical protein